MQAGQHLARAATLCPRQHAVEHAPGDQRHERARHAMAGAVADDDGITVIDRLEPEEVAAYDIARLPNQEMVGGDRGEFLARRQDRGLDAARIAQALQDELVGRSGPLLAFLDLGEIAIHRDAATAGDVAARVICSQVPSARRSKSGSVGLRCCARRCRSQPERRPLASSISPRSTALRMISS